MKTPIQVLIVDDSIVCQTLLTSILNAHPDINVIGCAQDGVSALSLTKKLKPDLIIMDIFMPKMDGVEATQAIMQQFPTPILVITAPANKEQLSYSFKALEVGALSIIEKPSGVLTEGFGDLQRKIVNSVKTLAAVHVIRRKKIAAPKSSSSPFPVQPILNAQILALGSSTGGPDALRSILSALSPEFPIPIVITQHITDGFLEGMVSWLQHSSRIPLEIANNDQPLYPGHGYFAPNNYHLIIEKHTQPTATLHNSDPVDNFRPSITAMFHSLATSYPGESIGGILTGMGRDGADGLLQMRQSGSTTFAQSKESSLIYGMPFVATSIDAVAYSVDLWKIPEFLTKLVCIRRS